MRRLTLVVVRARKSAEDGSLELLESRPCLHCCRACMKVGVQRVVYSDADGDLVSTRLDLIEQHATMSSGYRLLHAPEMATIGK